MSKVTISGNVSGTGTFTIASPNSNTDRTQSLPDGAGTFVLNGVNSAIVSGTAVASTSGTSIDFTGIPSWVKRITVMFSGVSTNGTSAPLVQLGTTSGVEATGYTTGGTNISASAAGSATYTTGIAVLQVGVTAAAQSLSAICTINLLNGNSWVGTASVNRTDSAAGGFSNGSKTLGGTLDRIRITTVGGTDTFDAGSINILYE